MTRGIKDSLQFGGTKALKRIRKTNNRISEQSVSYFSLFKYSTTLDKLCLLAGTICSIISGMSFPLLIPKIGEITGHILAYETRVSNGSFTEEEMGYLLDDVHSQILSYTIHSVVAGLIILVMSYVSTVLFNFTTTRQILKIRTKLFEKMLHQDMYWFDSNKTSDIATVLTDNLSRMETGMGDIIGVFIYTFSTFIAFGAVALFTGWKLALLSLVTLPMAIVTTAITILVSAKYYQKEMKSYEAAGVIAEEVLTFIKTVTAFSGRDKEFSRYTRHLVNAKNNNIARGLISGLNQGFCWFCIYTAYNLSFWYGSRLIVEDRYFPQEEQVYTPGSVLTICFASSLILTNLTYMIPMLEILLNAKVAAQKVFFLLNSEPTIGRHKLDGQSLNGFNSNITFENVCFNYPSRPDVKIIQNLNLRITKGETVALVGSSGCGKTTCIQLLLRLYEPLEGRILIDGIDLKHLSQAWITENIGVVSQEPVLFGTSIAQNIRYGKASATQKEIEEAAQKANVHTFVLSLPNGYQTILGEKGTQISGGQKQKIAIARALVKKPHILLLDEATSALDSTSEKEVQAALDKVVEKCTTIIVAHRMSTIRKANRIVVIDDGKISEIGTYNQLMTRKGAFHKLVNYQKMNRSLDLKEIYESEIQDIENTIPTVNKNDEEVENTDRTSHPQNVIWKILKMNISEWYCLIIGSISALLIGARFPMHSVVVGQILQVLDNPNDEELISTVSNYSLYFVFIGVALGIATFLQITNLSMSGEKLAVRIRSKMFDIMLRLDMGWFDKKENGVGALCARLTGDNLAVQQVFSTPMGVVLQIVSLFVFASSVCFYFEWRLSLVLTATAAVLFTVPYFQQKLSQRDAVKKATTLQISAKLAVESIGNIRTVASVGCENILLEQYVQELLPYQKMAWGRSHIRGIGAGLAKSIVMFIYPLGIWYGLKLLVEEHVPYGYIVICCDIIVLGVWSAGHMLAFCPDFQKGFVAASRIINFLEQVPTILNVTNPDTFEWDDETIEYSKVTFSYPTRPSMTVLNNLDLSVPQGRTIALVGPSGSGKTTVIQLLERFYDPFSGKITVNASDIKNYDIKMARSQMGVVFQEPVLFNNTIAENIAYGVSYKTIEMDSVIQAAKAANIHNFVSSLPQGYETNIGRQGAQLSGGQKQRIAIARALIRNPKILLLDEATSALDKENEKIVQEALDKAKSGRTCIIIAHRLSTIENADAICVFNNGSIVEMGTHRDLIDKKGLYCKLYKWQNDAYYPNI